MISVAPDVSKKIEEVITDYIELIIPGSGELKKKQVANSVKRNTDALKAIYSAIKHKQNASNTREFLQNTVKKEYTT